MKKHYLDPEFNLIPLSSACAFLAGSTDGNGTTPSTPEDWGDGDGNDFDEWN